MLFNGVIDFIAAHNCLVCGRSGQRVCGNCLQNSVVRKQPVCYGCNKLSPGGKTCPSCARNSDLKGVIVASYYEGVVKRLITGLKYEQATDLASLGAQLVAAQITPQSFDLLVPIPVTAAHYGFRGYNQAGLLAREVSKITRIPVINALGRLGNGEQVGKSRFERQQQVDGQFFARHETLITESRILLIDDVITTGATLAEAAKILKSAGAKSVWGAAVAKH